MTDLDNRFEAHIFNLETAVREGKVMQDFDLESLRSDIEWTEVESLFKALGAELKNMP